MGVLHRPSFRLYRVHWEKYQNHAATILRWAADDTAKAAPKQGIPDYTYKEGESL